jgi:hypothetical protein
MLSKFGTRVGVLIAVIAAMLFGLAAPSFAAVNGEDTVGITWDSQPVRVNFDNYPGNSWWGEATLYAGQVKGFSQPGAIDTFYSKVPTGFYTRPGWCSTYQWDVHYSTERYQGAARDITTGTSLVLGGDAGGVWTNVVSPAPFGVYTTSRDGTHVRIRHWDC